MLTAEETRVLLHLQKSTFSTVAEILQKCFPGAPAQWANRVLANLEWLNNLTVYYNRAGDPVAVQITEKGLALAQTLRPRVAT